MFETLARAIPQFTNVMLLLFLILTMFAILCVNLFGLVRYAPAQAFDTVWVAAEHRLPTCAARQSPNIECRVVVGVSLRLNMQTPTWRKFHARSLLT